MKTLKTNDTKINEITLSESEIALLKIKSLLSDWADSKISGDTYNTHEVKEKFKAKKFDSGNLTEINPYHFEQALSRFNVTNHFGNNVESLVSSIMTIVTQYDDVLEYESSVDFYQLNPRYNSECNEDLEMEIEISKSY